MYSTYILKSLVIEKFYIGSTSNLDDRIKRHNEGRERYTKKFIPWELVYYKEFDNRSEAYQFERYLKSLKNKNYIKNLIKDERGGSSTG
jgi:putative endonuclease